MFYSHVSTETCLSAKILVPTICQMQTDSLTVDISDFNVILLMWLMELKTRSHLCVYVFHFETLRLNRLRYQYCEKHSHFLSNIFHHICYSGTSNSYDLTRESRVMDT